MSGENRGRLARVVIVLALVGMSARAAEPRKEIVTVTPAGPTVSEGVVDGPEGIPQGRHLAPNTPEIVTITPLPFPLTDVPVTDWHCVENLADCATATNNACASSGHGGANWRTARITWCDNGGGSLVQCCMNTCQDGNATASCTAGG